MLTSTVSAIGYLITFVIQSLNTLTSSIPIFKSITNSDALAITVSDWVARLRQTSPDSWNSAQFDPSRWDHYALIIVFVGISSWGLWLSWCWNQEKRQTKGQINLTRNHVRDKTFSKHD